jgi:hypothetical protein
MNPPRCRLCGNEHWSTQPHKWDGKPVMAADLVPVRRDILHLPKKPGVTKPTTSVTEKRDGNSGTVTEIQGVTEKRRGRPKGNRTAADRQRAYRSRLGRQQRDS